MIYLPIFFRIASLAMRQLHSTKAIGYLTPLVTGHPYLTRWSLVVWRTITLLHIQCHFSKAWGGRGVHLHIIDADRGYYSEVGGSDLQRLQVGQHCHELLMAYLSTSFFMNKACLEREEIDGLVQDCSNSGGLAMELLQSCAKPLKYRSVTFQFWPSQVPSLHLDHWWIIMSSLWPSVARWLIETWLSIG